jgi:pimeloyl-ACP methyl ester carboxylesterase
VPSFAIYLLILLPGLALGLLVAFHIFMMVRYAPIIGRIFEEKPLFRPLKIEPVAGGDEVRFRTADDFELVGTYYASRVPSRMGVLVFCHEFLSDRWSFAPYLDGFRSLGFDVFTFDFRNHGESACDARYKPLQWVTDHEVRDLEAALACLRSRANHDRSGFGLFGISRGGSTALVAAAQNADVWGVITDGAFPTRGTMLAYIIRWAEIYVVNRRVLRLLPYWIFPFVGWAGRIRSERRLNCRFPDVERAVTRLAPRPWLSIHGEKDAYIGPDIARTLYDQASDPKELWIVPNAKHNRCRELDPTAYAERLTGFFRRHAPGLKRTAAPSKIPGITLERSAVEPPTSTTALPSATETPNEGGMPRPALSGVFASPVSG